ASVDESWVRFLGAAEIAGSIMLVVPSLTRVRPFLTPLAAMGFTAGQALLAMTHAARGEVDALPIALVLGSLAWFVFWGRQIASPIEPRPHRTSTEAHAH